MKPVQISHRWSTLVTQQSFSVSEKEEFYLCSKLVQSKLNIQGIAIEHISSFLTCKKLKCFLNKSCGNALNVFISIKYNWFCRCFLIFCSSILLDKKKLVFLLFRQRVWVIVLNYMRNTFCPLASFWQWPVNQYKKILVQ